MDIPHGLSEAELRDWLIQGMANIDLERAELKALARRAGRDQQAKDKIEALRLDLWNKREDLRIKLGDVNARIKKTNYLINNIKPRELPLAVAFMTAAEDMLDADTFAGIELQAVRMVEVSRGN